MYYLLAINRAEACKPRDLEDLGEQQMRRLTVVHLRPSLSLALDGTVAFGIPSNAHGAGGVYYG